MQNRAHLPATSAPTQIDTAGRVHPKEPPPTAPSLIALAGPLGNSTPKGGRFQKTLRARNQSQHPQSVHRTLVWDAKSSVSGSVRLGSLRVLEGASPFGAPWSLGDIQLHPRHAHSKCCQKLLKHDHPSGRKHFAGWLEH